MCDNADAGCERRYSCGMGKTLIGYLAGGVAAGLVVVGFVAAQPHQQPQVEVVTPAAQTVQSTPTPEVVTVTAVPTTAAPAPVVAPVQSAAPAPSPTPTAKKATVAQKPAAPAQQPAAQPVPNGDAGSQHTPATVGSPPPVDWGTNDQNLKH